MRDEKARKTGRAPSAPGALVGARGLQADLSMKVGAAVGGLVLLMLIAGPGDVQRAASRRPGGPQRWLRARS